MSEESKRTVGVDYWNSIASTYASSVVTPFYDEKTTAAFFSRLDTFCDHDNTWFTLEMGCGTGTLLEYLSERSALVKGMDFSPEMLREAEKKKRRNVELIEGRHDAVPFSQFAFDAVYAINSFLSVERSQRYAAFEEAHRVIKPDGFFYGLFPSNEHYLEQAHFLKEGKISAGMNEDYALQEVYGDLISRLSYDPIGGFVNVPDGSMRIKLYSEFELGDILDTVGFNDVHIERFVYPDHMGEEKGLLMGRNGIFHWLVKAQK